MSERDSADVLMLTNVVFPDKFGGLERYVSELASTYRSRGLRVEVVGKRLSADHLPEEEAQDGVRVRRIRVPSKRNPAFGLLYPLYIAWGVGRILRRHPGAVVHAHFVVPALVLALRPGRRRRPYLYTFHAPVYREVLVERQDSYFLPVPLQRLVVALLRAAEKLVVERAAQVVVLSEFTRRELLLLSPSAAARATSIAGGVDTTSFVPGPVEADFWADDAVRLVVTARRLTPRTGVVELIEAMPEVISAHPGTKLAVIGDGLLRGSAQRTIEQLGLADSVRLLGRVPDQRLRDWYRRADVAVTPTQELEGFGLSTAEAMACGTAPLVTPVGANPELVRSLPSSCMTEGTSPGELARGLTRCLSDESLPASAEIRAMTDVWSWPVVAQQHEQLMVRTTKEALRR